MSNLKVEATFHPAPAHSLIMHMAHEKGTMVDGCPRCEWTKDTLIALERECPDD